MLGLGHGSTRLSQTDWSRPCSETNLLLLLLHRTNVFLCKTPVWRSIIHYDETGLIFFKSSWRHTAFTVQTCSASFHLFFLWLDTFCAVVLLMVYFPSGMWRHVACFLGFLPWVFPAIPAVCTQGVKHKLQGSCRSLKSLIMLRWGWLFIIYYIFIFIFKFTLFTFALGFWGNVDPRQSSAASSDAFRVESRGGSQANICVTWLQSRHSKSPLKHQY